VTEPSRQMVSPIWSGFDVSGDRGGCNGDDVDGSLVPVLSFWVEVVGGRAGAVVVAVATAADIVVVAMKRWVITEVGNIFGFGRVLSLDWVLGCTHQFPREYHNLISIVVFILFRCYYTVFLPGYRHG